VGPISTATMLKDLWGLNENASVRSWNAIPLYKNETLH